MQKVQSPSSHFRGGRRAPVDTIVIHYISAVFVLPSDPFNLEANLKLLQLPIKYKLPDGQPKSVRVSAHYLLTREGEVHQLVDEDDVAWHAGRSRLGKREAVNEFSIGIELVGGEKWDYTEVQYETLAELIQDIRSRHNVPVENIVGHDKIATPKGRKKDPGKHFDWNRLRQAISARELATTG
jgi:AmpD protein